jgi:hypothetical protein
MHDFLSDPGFRFCILHDKVQEVQAALMSGDTRWLKDAVFELDTYCRILPANAELPTPLTTSGALASF